MSTGINTTYGSRVYEDPYMSSFGKDPPAGKTDREQQGVGRFDEKAATADIRSLGKEEGSHREKMMRVMDPQAYREYEVLKTAGGQGGNPVASMQFMLGWIEDKAVKDPGMERRFEKQQGAIKSLEDKFGNIGINVEGVDDKKGKDGEEKEFSITLTKDELKTLTYGTREEKEALYKQIDDAMKTIKEAEKKLSDEDAEKVKIGIDTKGGEDGKPALFGIGEDGKKTDGLFHESIFKEIFEAIYGSDEEKEPLQEVLREA